MRTHTVGWRTEKWEFYYASYLQLTEVSANTPPFAERQTKKKALNSAAANDRGWCLFSDKGALRKAAVKVCVFHWVTFNSLPPFPPSFLPKLPPSCLCTHRDQQVRESPQVTNCQPVCPTRLLAIPASAWACVYKNIEYKSNIYVSESIKVWRLQLIFALNSILTSLKT